MSLKIGLFIIALITSCSASGDNNTSDGADNNQEGNNVVSLSDGNQPGSDAGSGDAANQGDADADADNGPDATILQPGDPGCGFESAAFCETFDMASPGGRRGVDTDESRWAVSRWGALGGRLGHRGNFARLTASSSGSYFPPTAETPSLCGAAFNDVPVGEDFLVCDGRLEEVLRDDGNAFTINSMMARQVFDFTDRTGIITFDVDAKKEQGHGWWTEIWVSEEPQPIPYQAAPTVDSHAKNSIGIMLHGGENDDSCTGINSIFRTTNYELREWTDKFFEPESTQVLNLGCIATQDGVLNRIEIHLTADRIEVFGADAGQPETLRSIGTVDGLDLGFERGYVSFQHAHYNAAKADGDPGNTPVQTYRWDNLGFDGPVHAPIRAYDAEMPLQFETDEDDDLVQYGHELPTSITFDGVTIGAAKTAVLNISVSGDDDFEYRINGGEWRMHQGEINQGTLTGWSLPVPLDELQDGSNTLEIRSDEADKVGNIDLSLID